MRGRRIAVVLLLAAAGCRHADVKPRSGPVVEEYGLPPGPPPGVGLGVELSSSPPDVSRPRGR